MKLSLDIQLHRCKARANALKAALVIVSNEEVLIAICTQEKY